MESSDRAAGQTHYAAAGRRKRGSQAEEGAARSTPQQKPRPDVQCHCLPHEEHTAAQCDVEVCNRAVILSAEHDAQKLDHVSWQIRTSGRTWNTAFVCLAVQRGARGPRQRLTCSGSSFRVSATAAKQASVSVLSAKGPGRAPAASPMASISWAPEPTRRAKLLASDRACVSATAAVNGAVSSCPS